MAQKFILLNSLPNIFPFLDPGVLLVISYNHPISGNLLELTDETIVCLDYND